MGEAIALQVADAIAIRLGWKGRLEVWEPRITIEKIIIEPYPVQGIDKSVSNSYSMKGEEGRLDIIIYYRLKDQPDIHSFVYPYYLASATPE